MIKADGYYELPFGKGHKLAYRPLNRVIGGWILGGTMTWQSGAPFSILSERGTLNREARSYYNTADTSLTMSQLNSIVKFQMTGNGPMIVANSAINPADGTGVNTDGQPGFTGQVFSNPGAGTLGVLQRRLFDGPWTFTTDLRLKKGIAITGIRRSNWRWMRSTRSITPPSGRATEHQHHHVQPGELHVLPAARGQFGYLYVLMNALWETLSGARVYDLGQPYFTGMPHYPTHPPFLFGLTKRHGDTVGPAGHSSAADAIAMGSHVGTHIDALCHFSCGGKLHGGVEAEGVQSYGGGLREYSVDTIAPILRRGVLIDVAGGAPLAENFEITPAQLEGADVRRGDVVLLHRMGQILRGRSPLRQRDTESRSACRRAVAERSGHLRRGQRRRRLNARPTRRCRSTSTCWWRAGSTSSSA